MSLLINAIKSGDVQLVEELLQKGADVNLRMNNGATPLMIASQNGNIEIVDMLLAKGADIDHQGNDGATTLMLAAIEDHQAVVITLLSKGAKTDLKWRQVSTALHLAFKRGHERVVKILLSKGSEVRARFYPGASEIADLIDELIEIGVHSKDPSYSISGFLYKESNETRIKDPRTREIGQHLFKIGGHEQMYEAYEWVGRELGQIHARELESCWDKVGDWLG